MIFINNSTYFVTLFWKILYNGRGSLFTGSFRAKWSTYHRVGGFLSLWGGCRTCLRSCRNWKKAPFGSWFSRSWTKSCFRWSWPWSPRWEFLSSTYSTTPLSPSRRSSSRQLLCALCRRIWSSSRNWNLTCWPLLNCSWEWWPYSWVANLPRSWLPSWCNPAWLSIWAVCWSRSPGRSSWKCWSKIASFHSSLDQWRDKAWLWTASCSSQNLSCNSTPSFQIFSSERSLSADFSYPRSQSRYRSPDCCGLWGRALW